MKINIFRIRIYFLRGHSQWLLFPSWFLNFVVIQYTLFFDQFGIFANIFIFAFVFIASYIPLAILIGRWDYNKEDGNFKTEQELIKAQSPLYKELFARLDRIEEKIEK